MALSPQEKTYIDKLRAAGATKEQVIQKLQQRRDKVKNQWYTERVDTWVLSWLRNVGSGAIQAGGELAVGLPWQLSRLAPGNQSADKNSFYNKTQNLLNKTTRELEDEWADTNSLSYGFGKGVINMAAGSLIGWGVGNLAGKSKTLSGVWNTLSGTLKGRTALSAAQWATQGLWFDLASGKTPWVWTVAWAVIGWAAPLIGAAARWVAGKASGYAQKLSNQINKSKIGAYTESAVNKANTVWSNLFSGLKDTANVIKWQVSRIPSNIKTNVAAQKATQETIKKLPTVTAQKAVQDGVDIVDAQILPNVVSKIKPQAKELFNAVKQFEANPRWVNPIEIVGRPITKKLQQLEKTRQMVGKKLWDIADKSLGNVSKQEAVPMVFRELKKVQWLNGLKLDKKLQLDFADTVLATKATAADRKAIQSIFNDAINSGSGKSKHLLRQELFEILWGKKKSLQTLTDTQEKAYDAIRKGLSEILEGKNPQYKTLSNEYRKVIQPLSEMRKFMKTLPDATEDILDMKGGLLARRLTSNAVSNPQVRQLLRNLDKVSGGKTTESVESMQDLYNILNKYYNIAGKTGLQGQVTSALDTSIKWTLWNAIRNLAWQTESVTKKSLDEFLNELF